MVHTYLPTYLPASRGWELDRGLAHTLEGTARRPNRKMSCTQLLLRC